jgi:hypothetical protein
MNSGRAHPPDPRLDLVLERIVDVPPQRVWAMIASLRRPAAWARRSECGPPYGRCRRRVPGVG